MQATISDLIGYAIRATDGDLGKVDEFYFDDQSWTIRYVVVETGNWLTGRKVLISLAAFGKPETESRTFFGEPYPYPSAQQSKYRYARGRFIVNRKSSYTNTISGLGEVDTVNRCLSCPP
jgi:hypothetical protein